MPLGLEPGVLEGAGLWESRLGLDEARRQLLRLVRLIVLQSVLSHGVRNLLLGVEHLDVDALAAAVGLEAALDGGIVNLEAWLLLDGWLAAAVASGRLRHVVRCVPSPQLPDERLFVSRHRMLWVESSIRATAQLSEHCILTQCRGLCRCHSDYRPGSFLKLRHSYDGTFWVVAFARSPLYP